MKLRIAAKTFEVTTILGRKLTIHKSVKQSLKATYLVCTALLCAGLAYLFQSQSKPSGSVSAAKAVPQLNELTAHNSFSIIENTRQDLEGMCKLLKLEAEVRLVEQGRLAPIQSNASGMMREAHLARIIHDLESEMHDFEGTDEALDLAEDLLRALKRADETDRWIDVYLKALYEHPTHPIVAVFAEQAIAAGKAGGRYQEVIAGLTHVSSIPRDFQGKDRIDTTLIMANESRSRQPDVAAFANR